MSFWTRLLAIDRRWIYLVVWVVVMVPLLFPFAIKPKPTTPVEKLFNYVDTMPEDRALVISFDYTPDTQAELHPMAIALMRHALSLIHI